MSLNIKRYLTKENQTAEDVYNEVNWETTTVSLKNREGKIIFEQKVEFPDYFSENARLIVASKYFYGKPGTDEREYSLKQLISRVINKICNEGLQRGYFSTHSEATDGHNSCIIESEYVNDSEYNIFKAELTYIILHQMFSYNSPVWFNVGTPNRQAVSACYITSLEDDLIKIFEHSETEGRIFRDGAGVGVNISNLRGEGEPLTGGGASSGPLSFDRIFDSVAKATKSGGRNRRAARMIEMDIDHPDIEKFLTCKSEEEKKAIILRDAGYSDGIDGEAYGTVAFQNGNYSVRIPDEFMKCVENNGNWSLINRVDGSISKTLKARYLWNLIAEQAWNSGDPGIQFSTTMEAWNTCKKSGKINGTNPCVHGDTIIRLDTGNYSTEKIKIKDAVGRTEKIYSVDTNWGWDQTTGFYNHGGIVKSGIKQCITISLEESKEYKARSITVTPNHKILKCEEKVHWRPNVKDDLVEASCLKEGDYIVVLRENSWCLHPYPAKITKIEDAGECEVYDVLNVEPSNLFVANDIVVSNCSEFVFHDNTSCNLASINYLKLLRGDSTINYDLLRHIVYLATISMNILIDFAEYPTEEIAQGTRKFRPLGIGGSNLGALCMAKGLPYDSEEARTLASELTLFMTSAAYYMSYQLASIFGPFSEYDKNKDCMEDIMISHLKHAQKLLPKNSIALFEFADIINNYEAGLYKTGYRNAYVTNYAPCGTISFMMDCSTTGCEPELALIKYKTLVGGGVLKTVNPIMGKALKTLGYDNRNIEYILNYIKKYGTIEQIINYEKDNSDSNTLKAEHLPVFDCSFKPINGTRFISPEGHVKMLAAIQPFISGASSKTVNLPNDCTIQDIQNIYMLAWKLGIKCIAVYRDGCKMNQPMKTENKKEIENTKNTENLEKTHHATSIHLNENEVVIPSYTTVYECEYCGKKSKPMKTRICGGPAKYKSGYLLDKIRNIRTNEKDGEEELLDLIPDQEDKKPNPFSKENIEIYNQKLINDKEEEKTNAKLGRLITPKEAIEICNKIRDDAEKEIQKDRLQEASRMETDYLTTIERHKMPDTRKSVTHKIKIGANSFYITVGMYDDGSVGEVFVTTSRHGSFASGSLDAVATFISFCLQYGAPLEDIVRKLKGINFAPNVITSNKDIPFAKSILDYLGKYLEMNFLSKEYVDATPDISEEEAEKMLKLSLPKILPNTSKEDLSTPIKLGVPKDLGFTTGVPPQNSSESLSIDNEEESQEKDNVFDNGDGTVMVMSRNTEESKKILSTGQVCPRCGSIMVTMGRCFYCLDCNESTGGCS